MNKVLVFKQEIITTISRVSFWVGALGIPLLGFVILGVAGILNGRSVPPSMMENLQGLVSQEVDTRPIGLVDPQKFIDSSADLSFPIQYYPNEESALHDLQVGKIRAYASIPADYLATGRAIYVQEKLQISENDPKDALERLLTVSVLKDPKLALLVRQPLAFRHLENISETPQADIEGNPASYFVPYLLGMVFYMVTLGTATTMLSSMEREKENRVLESLLCSLSPIDILSGKILALGMLGLLQAVAWFGGAFLLAGMGASVLPAMLGQIHLSTTLLWWSLGLFVLGYFFNASIMGAAGALADSSREASQVSMLIVLSAVIPMMFNAVIIDAPHSTLSIALSLIPPTAPMTLVMRMASTTVPWWQIVSAMLLLVLSDYLLIRAAANVFRTNHLLHGGKVSIPAFIRTLLAASRRSAADR